jgi:hypothetical protein
VPQPNTPANPHPTFVRAITAVGLQPGTAVRMFNVVLSCGDRVGVLVPPNGTPPDLASELRCPAGPHCFAFKPVPAATGPENDRPLDDRMGKG